MKKLILCGLAFFALSIVSCKSKDDDAKKECDAKKDTHVWDAEAKECKAKPAESLTQAECNQDLTKKWDVTANDGKGGCRDATKEECVLPQVTWDEANSKCVLKSSELAEAQYKYTVTMSSLVKSNTAVNHIKLTAENKQSSLFKINDCVKLKESEFADLVIATYKTEKWVQSLCDSASRSSERVAPVCEPGNYNVGINANRVSFDKANVVNPNKANCKVLQ